MIEDQVKELAREANYAALTTLSLSGRPMTHLMWVDCDAEHVIVNTEIHRAKYRNVEHDPRVAIVIWDDEDPYRYVEVRGRVVESVRGPEARRHIDELSHKYTGAVYANPIESERVILRILPSRQRAAGG
ncbi:MAG: TIGR03618 family F420-dependent PPOX class oxidoreductase [Actinomycetota bacterium]|nr:TIGR03618 family F420-dependent PPOX class oxidoreductase [Actinomycetota bacterium]